MGFSRKKLAKFRTSWLSAPMSNFRTFHVLINEISNLRTFQDLWEPSQWHVHMETKIYTQATDMKKVHLFCLLSGFLAELVKALRDADAVDVFLGISWLSVRPPSTAAAAACLGLLVGTGLLGRMFLSISSSLSTSSAASAVKLWLEPVVLSSCR